MNNIYIVAVAVIVMASVSEGASSLGKNCTKDADCTTDTAGSYCQMFTDCAQGACRCIQTDYYTDGTACTKVTKLLGKGDTCVQGKKEEQCGEDLMCNYCVLKPSVFYCGAHASFVTLSTSLFFLVPAALKLFY